MNKSLKIVNAHIEMFKNCQKAYAHASDIETANEYKEDIKIFETIKQDLEAYEKLKQEYQKLKKDYNLLDTTMESDDRLICQLLNEKEQLKKAIEILKKYLFLADEKSLVWNKGYGYSTDVSDEDFEELKEVLE